MNTRELLKENPQIPRPTGSELADRGARNFGVSLGNATELRTPPTEPPLYGAL